MGRFILGRLAFLVPTLVLVIVISTFLMKAAPGSPFAAEKEADPAIQKQIEKKWGEDKSSWGWLKAYFAGLLKGDLGPSYKVQGKTVKELLAPALPVSLCLGLLALMIAVGIGLPAGMFAGLRQNTTLDYGSMLIALVGVSLPTFVLGTGLLWLFVFQMDALPVGGWGTLEQLILPAITLALPFAAYIARLARAGVLEVVHEDYIKTARAKGLPPSEVVLKHLIRGAVLPVVSYLGPAAASILTGGFVVEKLFRIPGMGSYFVASAINRDYFLVLGTVIVYVTLLTVFNLIVDISYAMIDPRMREHG
ncbi:MAG: ABC transporter permease [Planctomycetota bacterium]|nr:ABC transporter permease [Planctomycetota bacterium]